MMTSFSFNYFDSTITARSLGLEFVPSLDKIITVHCLPITEDGNVIAVDIAGRGIDVPGGHIEDGETAEKAMHRELYEEAFIKVTKPILIDVWYLKSKNKRLGLDEKPYLLLYVAEVKAMDRFVPNDEVHGRIVLRPHEFAGQYFGDKEQAKNMLKQAIKALGSK